MLLLPASALARPLTSSSTQHYHCVVLPGFNEDGNLPVGVYWTTWEEFVNRFSTTPHRRRLMAGLKAALDSLKIAGCQTAYIDGSFVTAKEVPNDFDACWEVSGVDPYLLDPILLMFGAGRAAQKAKYFGELLPNSIEGSTGLTFLEFFQIDKETGNQKGVVALDLRRLP